ncbi:MAG: ArsR family transcriptional regulator [Calditrichaeota bacterium]|nr:MAG: ArsR family transcriptional regulator [Calditrichota bacterium]
MRIFAYIQAMLPTYNEIKCTFAECCDTKLMKILSEPIRVELYAFLVFHGQSDIKTIAEHFAIDRSNVSRHLQMMADAEILEKSKQSRHIYYKVNLESLESRVQIMLEMIRMIKERRG